MVTRNGNLVRSSYWNGVNIDDAVLDEWVEVRGGRPGEAKGRSFRPELIYPVCAKKGSRITGQSLAIAPLLPLS